MNDLEVYIDPGLKNLCFCIPSLKKMVLLHLNKLDDLTKTETYKELFDLTKNNPIILVSEQQIVRKNILIQGIILGYLSGILNVKKIQSIHSNIKLLNAKNFNFIYAKINTKKKFLNLPSPFKDHLQEYDVIEIYDSKKNILKIKDLHKKDDVIDSVLLKKL